MERQLVVFELANEYYGVDIHRVDGIIRIQTITAVPHAPEFVDGVTNLRGEILPVINLRRRFNMPEIEHTNNTRIVVSVMNGTKVGMIVDGVSEVLNINQDAIEPPSPMVTNVDTNFIEGIAKEKDRLIILVALGKVLSASEKVQPEQTTLEAA